MLENGCLLIMGGDVHQNNGNRGGKEEIDPMRKKGVKMMDE
jgi:hypothetical protein